MIELIIKLHTVLNLFKDFKAGYSSKSAKDGYMLIEHNNTRYAVKIEEITYPKENINDDIERLEYLI